MPDKFSTYFQGRITADSSLLPLKCTGMITGLGISMYSAGLEAAIKLALSKAPYKLEREQDEMEKFYFQQRHQHQQQQLSNLNTTQNTSHTSQTIIEPRPRSKITASLDELFPHPSDTFYQPQISSSTDLSKLPSWLLSQLNNAQIHENHTNNNNNSHNNNESKFAFSSRNTQQTLNSNSTPTLQSSSPSSPSSSALINNNKGNHDQHSFSFNNNTINTNSNIIDNTSTVKLASTNPQYFQSLQFELAQRASASNNSDPRHLSDNKDTLSSEDPNFHLQDNILPAPEFSNSSLTPNPHSNSFPNSSIPLHHQLSLETNSSLLSSSSTSNNRSSGSNYNKFQSVDWEDDFAEIVEPSVNRMNNARSSERSTHNSDRDSYIDELFFPQLYGKDTR